MSTYSWLEQLPFSHFVVSRVYVSLSNHSIEHSHYLPAEAYEQLVQGIIYSELESLPLSVYCVLLVVYTDCNGVR